MKIPKSSFELDDSSFSSLKERKVLIDLLLASGVKSMTHKSNYMNEGSTVIWYGQIDRLDAYYPSNHLKVRLKPAEFCAKFGITWPKD